MIEEKQINLFDVVKYGGKKTRGHYNKKQKEIKELSPYQKLSILRAEIANYLPMPLMAEINECTTHGFLKLWYSHYKNEDYIYENGSFKGEEFKIIEAELIGTERLSIDKCLYLHKKLLELTNSGINIQEAAEEMQPEINKMRLDNDENYTVA